MKRIAAITLMLTSLVALILPPVFAFETDRPKDDALLEGSNDTGYT